MFKKEKQEVVKVKVQNILYNANVPFDDLTEKKLQELEPMAYTEISLTLEKDDNFESNVNDLLGIEVALPGRVLEETNVLYVRMWLDCEIAFKSIQKCNL